jgi:hypothetical protein
MSVALIDQPASFEDKKAIDGGLSDPRLGPTDKFRCVDGRVWTGVVWEVARTFQRRVCCVGWSGHECGGVRCGHCYWGRLAGWN